MLHILKDISTRYFKRVKGLFQYIFDYKVLLFSILYMLITYLSLHFLRNTDERGTIGLFLAIFSLFLFFLLGFFLLRNIVKEVDSILVPENATQKHMKIFVHLLFVSLLVFIVLARSSPLVIREREIDRNTASFTEVYVSFEAYIVDEVDKKYRNQQMQLKQLQDISVGGQILAKNHGYILTRVENYRTFSVGQVCNFSGTLVEPENFSDFDYKTYLKNQKIFYILENPTYICFDITEKRAGNPLRNSLIDIKEKIVGDIDEVLSEPQSSLLAGILFGKKRRLERTFEENIRVAGVSHVITASGYNITILIIMINKVLFFLPKKIKIMSCLILIWCFALFSGLSNSIIRACIMNTLSLVAVLFGRDNKIHISLPLASAIFVFLDPLIILNIGFLLSISAILGLVYISPILQAVKKKFTKKKNFLDDYIFPTLSCTIGTFPISTYTFETFSIWAIPVNALILPVVESAMLWGVLSLFFLHIHQPLSKLFFTAVDLQLKYFEHIVTAVGGSGLLTNLSGIISLAALLVIIPTVIYFYPIDNEKYNYYLKNN